MQALDPQLVAVAALTTAIGYSMIAAGIAKKRLGWRRRPACKTCGYPTCRCRFL